MIDLIEMQRSLTEPGRISELFETRIDQWANNEDHPPQLACLYLLHADNDCLFTGRLLL